MERSQSGRASERSATSASPQPHRRKLTLSTPPKTRRRAASYSARTTARSAEKKLLWPGAKPALPSAAFPAPL